MSVVARRTILRSYLAVSVVWDVVLVYGLRKKACNDKNRHKCQSEYTCNMCKEKACLYKPSYTRLCKECVGVFRNITCFKHHKQNEVCARATSCQKCSHWFAGPVPIKYANHSIVLTVTRRKYTIINDS